MRISRRKFLGSGAVSVAGVCLLESQGILGGDGRSVDAGDCLVLDLREACVLRESLRGYVAALGDSRVCEVENFGVTRKGLGLVIVPGLGKLEDATVAALLECLDSGATVLLESGAGFLAGDEFASQQKLLRENFEVFVDAPVDVCRELPAVPYVSYAWPKATMVRDFSRVVPVLAEEREVIGRLEATAVACRKRARNGEVIFLGSPMGPALWAGDAQARVWVENLTRETEGAGSRCGMLEDAETGKSGSRVFEKLMEWSAFINSF